jgi:hypothetical protein
MRLKGGELDLTLASCGTKLPSGLRRVEEVPSWAAVLATVSKDCWRTLSARTSNAPQRLAAGLTRGTDTALACEGLWRSAFARF